MLACLAAAFLLASAWGCVSPRVQLFTDATDPLEQYTLSGTGEKKVLLIPIEGIISDSARDEILRSRPGMVQEVVAQLDLAKSDPSIRALLLKIDSPGGSVTASDILYNEIEAFKKETGIPVVASMMNVAASGAYYAALSADRILAHPTSITGSIGVLFINPDLTGLMEKVGVDVNVYTSGRNKDMGSPFRQSTEREEKLFEKVVASLARRFIHLVEVRRHLSPEQLEAVSTARIFLADEALQYGLIDKIAYLPEAVSDAEGLAGLPAGSRLVVYRRTRYANDNIYNNLQMRAGNPPLIDTGLPSPSFPRRSGFYYLWAPAATDNP
jgi:protease-4